MSNHVVLTKEGQKQLQERLDYLKNVKRAECTNAIAVARSFGDLSENSEYVAAKEEQGLVESEIMEIEEKLRNAKIISGNVDTSQVSLGCTVKVHDINFDEELWHLTPSELKVGVTIEGKEVFRDWQSDYVKGHEYDSFSKKMKSMKLPSEPYNMVCMMAMTAALPEVEKVETQLRQDREKSKKQEQIAIDVQKKKVSEFLGHDR